MSPTLAPHRLQGPRCQSQQRRCVPTFHHTLRIFTLHVHSCQNHAYNQVSFSALSWFASASKTSTWISWSWIGKKVLKAKAPRVTVKQSYDHCLETLAKASLKQKVISLNCGLTLKGLLDTPSASVGLSAEVGLGTSDVVWPTVTLRWESHADERS